MKELLELQQLVIDEVVEAVTFAISWGACNSHSCNTGELPDNGTK